MARAPSELLEKAPSEQLEMELEMEQFEIEQLQKAPSGEAVHRSRVFDLHDEDEDEEEDADEGST
jgi:hypothetical protein